MTTTETHPPQLLTKTPEHLAPLITSPISRWLIPFAFILFSAIMAIASTGFLEADEVTHFLKARAIWHDWHAILDIWGRFGANGLYGLAAPFGVTAARLVAVAVTTLTGIGTTIVLKYFLADDHWNNSWFKRHGIAVAWLLLFAQPCFALNSFTVMTEMLLACTWVWAVAILIMCREKKNRGMILASLILGLGGLMRPEGWIAVAVWPAFAFLWMRRTDLKNSSAWGNRRGWGVLVASIFAAGLPSLVWYALGVIGNQDWLWVIHGWPWAVTSIYGKTGRIFLLAVMASMAYWLWFPVLIGIAGLWRPEGGSPKTIAEHRQYQRDARLLLVAPFIGLFLIHGLLGSFGLLGSMSLPRYFISVAPMAAVLGIFGLMRLEQLLTGKFTLALRAATISLALGTLVSLMGLQWLPMRADAESRRLDVVIFELRCRVPANEISQRLIAGHPYVSLVLDLPPSGEFVNRVFSSKAMAEAPVGTFLITDSMLWCNERRPPPEQLEAWGYRMDEAVAEKVDAVTMAIEPWAVNWAPGKVRLWIKQNP